MKIVFKQSHTILVSPPLIVTNDRLIDILSQNILIYVYTYNRVGTIKNLIKLYCPLLQIVVKGFKILMTLLK